MELAQTTQHDMLGFAHGQPANGVPLKTDIHKGAGRHFAQIRERLTLHNAEKQVARCAGRVGFTAAPRPSRAEFGGLAGVVMACPETDTLVKLHHDVGIEIALDGNNVFRREKML